MIDISVSGLSKEFEVGTRVLDGLTFQVDAGERVGLLGKNGSGKTTVFRILTGELDYDAGEVSLAPGRRLGLISQIPVYPDGYTVDDVLRTAFDRLVAMESEMAKLTRQMEHSADPALLHRYGALAAAFETGGGYDTVTPLNKVCNGLGIAAPMRAQLFANLSGGEKTRINLARLILEETDILLLDEPTNHLDLHATQWLEEYLAHYKGTVLVISHDRWFLDNVVTRVVEINRGKAEFYAGNYSFYAVEKEKRYLEQLRRYQKEQAKIAQLQGAADTLHLWAFMGNDALHKRAFSIEKRIERLRTTDRPKQEKALTSRFGQWEFYGNDLLDLYKVTKTYGDRTLLSELTLSLGKGDRIALLGPNGAGKTTLLKLILQEELPDSGVISLGPTVKIGYLPQIVRFAHPKRSLLDTMLYEQNCTTQEARNRLAAFRFQGDDVFQAVSTLSGGEQSRLRLCMLMDARINLLILDEPTNHLDLPSREWIEAAVEDYDGALLFVSHDRYFIDRFAQRIWTLENGAITVFDGGFAAYQAAKDRATPPPPPPSAPLPAKPKRERRPGGVKALEKETAAAERAVARAEERLYDLTLHMGEDEVATNYLKLQELGAEKTALEEEIARLYTLWETLAQELEEAGR